MLLCLTLKHRGSGGAEDVCKLNVRKTSSAEVVRVATKIARREIIHRAPAPRRQHRGARDAMVALRCATKLRALPRSPAACRLSQEEEE